MQDARKVCDAAGVKLAKAEAEAQQSGARTALEMAQLDIALEAARTERARAEHALTAAEARLASTRGKLETWRSRA